MHYLFCFCGLCPPGSSSASGRPGSNAATALLFIEPVRDGSARIVDVPMADELDVQSCVLDNLQCLHASAAVRDA